MEGDINDPLSLNLYTYVSNNPVLYVDPSGNYQAIAGCMMRCFSAGTNVKTDEGYKTIEDIKVGDMVQTKDEETGEVGYHPVEELFQRETEETYQVTVKGTTITTTEEHPFWITGKGWVEAKDLKEGDKLQDPDGKEYPIEKIEIKNERTTVYNFRVQGVHNYFVTELQIWTHNCGRGVNNSTSYYSVGNSGGGGVAYQRPVNVNRLPAGTGINITKKEMDSFFKSTMNKGLKSKATGQLGASNVKLSNNLVDHILTRHSVNSTKNQLPYLQKKLSDQQINEMLSKKSFFNKEWSDQKITDASTSAVNQLKQQGINDGLHTVNVFGERIKVFFKNGTVDSVYGTHIYKLKDILD